MQVLRRIFRRASRVPADLAHKISNFAVIEARLFASYQRAIEEHKPHLPALSATESDIVAALRRNGVVETNLEALDFPDSGEMFRDAIALRDAYAHRAALGRQTFSDPYLICATPAERLRHPQLFRWGLNRRLLNIVESYLELPVAYNGVNLFYTLADGIQRGSRVWHRDGEDRRTVKIGVYINDVDIDGGPFQVFCREIPSTEHHFHKFTHEALEERFATLSYLDEIRTCVGSAGTVIFVDTARSYHRGRPAMLRDRCALFYNYFSRPPRNPYYCEGSALSPLQIIRLTSDLTPYQRECALWRESLPAIGSFFPQKARRAA